MKKKIKDKLGITLIELLIVLAILSIIGAIGVPWYQGYKRESEEKMAMNNLQLIKLAQSDYYDNNYNYYPCPPGKKTTNEIDKQFFGGNGDLSKGAYFYEIVGNCTTYKVLALPK